MRQVVQSIKSGESRVQVLPDPLAPPGGVLVANAASLISAGTERYVVELTRKSLLGKARARPDHVRRVLQKLRQEGLASTFTQVRAKLDEAMPLGYSSAGIVLECGAGVQDLKPGDRVAAAAPHAELVAVSRMLCARVPDEVGLEQACYASVGAIALQGVRLARVELGSRVLVIGLGLVGQLTVSLLRAQGCHVFGADLDSGRLELGRAMGARHVSMKATPAEVFDFAGPGGVDAVLITAATDSNGPIELAAEVARRKGRIVLVGVAGLNVPRQPFFEKELELTVSSSLGPGRYDPAYAERGRDYPLGEVRWTAQRNMQAFLEAVATGAVHPELLTTHRFPIQEAPAAYDLITQRSEPLVGVLLEYPAPPQRPRRRLDLRAPSHPRGALRVSVIGAGNFARLVLLPALRKLSGVTLRGIASAGGLNAVHTGRGLGFEFAATDPEEILADEDTEAVFVLTRHDLHGSLALAALQAGKHVFVEKPLSLTPEDLAALDREVRERASGAPLLTVGFNRRFSPGARALRAHFAGLGPLSCSFRFMAGPLPAKAWPQDEEVGGGRLVGEACHAIDTCTFLQGSPPVRVHAEAVALQGSLETSHDRAFLTLVHANGGISSVSYQAGGDRAGPRERIEVFGGGRSGFLSDWSRLELWQEGQVVRTKSSAEKGHSSELERFVSACSGGAWPIPWEDLYGVTWASLAAVRSLRTGLAQNQRDDEEDGCAEGLPPRAS